MAVDIEQVLEHRYSQYQWGIKNNDYDSLEWSANNDIPKPTYEELISHTENPEVEKAVSTESVINKRQTQILENWPIEKQFEALTENAMGRPEKLNNLINFITKTKEDHPKPS